MTSAEEEVRKRRAKGQGGSPRVVEKLVLLAGIISVLVAIGLSPGMAPMLSAGIIGITLLLFFWLRNHRPQEMPGEESGSQEGTRASEEKTVDPAPADSDFQEKEPIFEREGGDREKAAPIPGVVFERKPETLEEPSPGKRPALQEHVLRIEKRLAEIEEKLARMEEKLAAGQDPEANKVDLQKIFSQMEEKEAQSGAAQRSYQVQTEIPTP